MEKNKITDFKSLGGLKEELIKNEPIKEGGLRTRAMLTSPVSKKLLKYFSLKFPEILEGYSNKDSERFEFVKEIKKILSNDEDSLPVKYTLSIDNLYLRFIKKIPISESANRGVVFGEWARQAGCKDQEAKEAQILLGTFIKPVLKNTFKEE